MEEREENPSKSLILVSSCKETHAVVWQGLYIGLYDEILLVKWKVSLLSHYVLKHEAEIPTSLSHTLTCLANCIQ